MNMKKIKFSKKVIIISLACIATVIAIDVILLAGGIFMTGHRMARYESHPLFEMQVFVDDGMATMRIVNHSESQCEFGQQFTLYKRFGWRWRRIEFAQERLWRGGTYILSPNFYGDRPPIDLYEYFGELPSGEYRIVTEVWITSPRVDSTRVAGGFRMP